MVHPSKCFTNIFEDYLASYRHSEKKRRTNFLIGMRVFVCEMGTITTYVFYTDVRPTTKQCARKDTRHTHLIGISISHMFVGSIFFEFIYIVYL